MRIKCRICKRVWNCAETQCKIRIENKKICELCLECYAEQEFGDKRNLETIKATNCYCYPDSYDIIKEEKDVNPSRRDNRGKENVQDS